jgi:hypothetical protein
MALAQNRPRHSEVVELDVEGMPLVTRRWNYDKDGWEFIYHQRGYTPPSDKVLEQLGADWSGGAQHAYNPQDALKE